MTDPRDPNVERRLRAWFSAEVRRAERDLTSAPPGPLLAPVRRRASIPAGLVVAAATLVVAVGVLGGLTRPAKVAQPPAATGSGPASVPSTTSPTGGPAFDEPTPDAWYPDGIPAKFFGDPVLRPAAAARRLAGKVDGTSFLVGGWPGGWTIGGCSTIDAGGQACGAWRLGETPGATTLSVTAVGGALYALPPSGPTVVRIHRDAASGLAVLDALVWSPDTTVTGRYADGIPAAMNGEPVFRAAALLAAIQGPRAGTGGRSFLLGGWSPDPFTRACPAVRSDQAMYALAPACGGWPIGETPQLFGVEPTTVDAILMGRTVPAGPVVLRVHDRDPAAAACPADLQARCETAVVVDAVIWNGDELTASAPLRADQAMTRLLGPVPALHVLSRTPAPAGENLPLLGSDCNPGWPVQTWQADGVVVGSILVFPTVAARAAAEPNFLAGGYRGATSAGASCLLTVDSFGLSDWVGGANVLVQVYVRASGPTQDQLAVAGAIATALGSAGP